MKSGRKIKKLKSASLVALGFVVVLIIVWLVASVADSIRKSEEKRIDNDIIQTCETMCGDLTDNSETIKSRFITVVSCLSQSTDNLFSDKVVTCERKIFGSDGEIVSESNIVPSDYVLSILNGVSDKTDFNEFSIIRSDGFAYKKFTEKEVIFDLRENANFLSAMQGNYSISYLDESEREHLAKSFFLFAPISDVDDNIVAVATTRLSFEAFFSSSKLNPQTTSRKFAIVDEVGGLKSQLDAIAGIEPLYIYENFDKSDIDRREPSIIGGNGKKDGVYVLGTTLKISGLDKNWYLVGLFEQNEITEYVNNYVNTTRTLLIIAVALLLAFFVAELYITNFLRSTTEKEIEKYTEAFDKFKKTTFEFNVYTREIQLSTYAQKLLGAKYSVYNIEKLAKEVEIEDNEIKNVKDEVGPLLEKGSANFNVFVEKVNKYLHIELYVLKVKTRKKLPTVIGIVEDVTTGMMTRRALEQKVMTDALTKLMSREAVIDVINEKLATAGESRSAFMLMDIDDFKQMNDSYGHYVGDILLQKFGEILKSVSKKGSIYSARLSGDEFAVFISHFESLKEVREIASLICSEASSISVFDSNHYGISVSVGVALYPAHGDTFEKLRQCADNALYESKKRIGSYITIFNSMENEITFKPDAKIGLMAIEEKFTQIMSAGGGVEKIGEILHQAMREGEVKIYLQPKVSTRDDTIESEVLARWESKEYGLVMPVQFLPMFEYAKMTTELDSYVLEKSLQFINQNMAEFGAIKLSLNQSLTSVTTPYYTRKLEELAAKYDIPRNTVTIEITERRMFISLRTISKVISLMRQIGFKVSIDDFGTGYTTLNIIKDLDIDEIKIDKGFIDINKSKAVIIVKELCQMAQSMHVTTVAEGVETREQMQFLTDVGCDYLQGFYFSQAVLPEEFLQNVKNGTYIAKKNLKN